MKKLLTFIMVFCFSLSYAFDGKEQPIKFVIPFAPGGGTDSAIKIYEKYINELGYKTIVEYKPGADGLIGKKDYVEKNNLSGYSLLVTGSVPMAHDDTFAKDKGWNINDFKLITDIIDVPNAVVSSKKSGITDFQILKTKVRNGEKLSFAYGALQGKFSSMILLDDIKNDSSQVIFVGYKGAAPALNDVTGGHADLVMVPISMALQLYEADKINVLFVGGNKRFNKMKDVPTASEVKTSLTYVGSWGVVLPKNVDDEIAQFYVSLFKKIASDPRFIYDLSLIDASISHNRIGPEAMLSNYNKHLKLFGRYSDVR